jgi:hypothetical protein
MIKEIGIDSTRFADTSNRWDRDHGDQDRFWHSD